MEMQLDKVRADAIRIVRADAIRIVNTMTKMKHSLYSTLLF